MGGPGEGRARPRDCGGRQRFGEYLAGKNLFPALIYTPRPSVTPSKVSDRTRHLPARPTCPQLLIPFRQEEVATNN